jgi:hypothetical protein
VATAIEVFAVDAAAAGCAAVFFIAAWGSGTLGVLLATTTGNSREKDCAGGASRGALGTAFAVSTARSVDGTGGGADGYNGVLTGAGRGRAAVDEAAALTCTPAFLVCGAEFPSRRACTERRSPVSLPAAFNSSIKVANGEPAFDAGAAPLGIAGIFTNVATELAA